MHRVLCRLLHRLAHGGDDGRQARFVALAPLFDKRLRIVDLAQVARILDRMYAHALFDAGFYVVTVRMHRLHPLELRVKPICLAVADQFSDLKLFFERVDVVALLRPVNVTIAKIAYVFDVRRLIKLVALALLVRLFVAVLAKVSAAPFERAVTNRVQRRATFDARRDCRSERLRCSAARILIDGQRPVERPVRVLL